MRIARQSAAPCGPAVFLTEAVQICLGQATFQKRPSIGSGARMALEEDLITTARMVLAPPKVVQAHFIDGRCGRVGGDMAPHANTGTLLTMHEHRRVPPQHVLDFPFQLFVARVGHFLGFRDGVDVIRVQQ